MPDKKVNPFSSSRVDTPFQNHIDLKDIYQHEFGRLLAVIEDIEQDTQNHQSKGAVVIGEPGSGKTHLMMRLAQARLKTNRLLFIRQPNHLNAVLYHIYSRVLESFAQNVPDSPYSQFEHFLANVFAKIIKEMVETAEQGNEAEGLFSNLFARKGIAHKYRDILEIISTNPLDIYQALGKEGSGKKREYWQRIEKIVSEWWKQHYSDAGQATAIIQGIIKFCSYSDPYKRQLVGKWLAADELEEDTLINLGLKNWQVEMSRESFSLEAMTVFGRLSIMDEPLIIIFDQLEALGLPYNENLLCSFGDTVKELFTHVPNSLIILNLFPDRWEHFKNFFDGAVVDRISQCQIVLDKPSASKLEEMLILKAFTHQIAVEHIFSPEDLEVILNQESIRSVLNCASDYYKYRVEGIPLPKATHFKRFEDELKTELADIKRQISTDHAPQFSEFIQEIRTGFQTLQKEMMALRQILEKKELPIVENVPNVQPLSADIKEEIPENKKYTPVLTYFEHERQLLEETFTDFMIISDADDVGKLRMIVEAFSTLRDFEVDFLRLGKKSLPEHLVITQQDKSYAVGFLQAKGTAFTTRIQNFNQLVINDTSTQFLLFRDAREPEITAKVGASEIKKLNNAPNG